MSKQIKITARSHQPRHAKRDRRQNIRRNLRRELALLRGLLGETKEEQS